MIIQFSNGTIINLARVTITVQKGKNVITVRDQLGSFPMAVTDDDLALLTKAVKLEGLVAINDEQPLLRFTEAAKSEATAIEQSGEAANTDDPPEPERYADMVKRKREKLADSIAGLAEEEVPAVEGTVDFAGLQDVTEPFDPASIADMELGPLKIMAKGLGIEFYERINRNQLRVRIKRHHEQLAQEVSVSS